MKHFVLVGLSCIALVGCKTTQQPTRTQVVLIEPPSALMSCPGVPKPPKASTLTNQQIADYIDKLRYNAAVCSVNMKQIKKYVDEAKKTYVK